MLNTEYNIFLPTLRLSANSSNMDNFTKIQQINIGLAKRFPDHNSPFHILARLLEECGELAEQVHIHENVGIKRQKHGDPDRTKLAKEVQDVLRAALQIAAHYNLDAELTQSIDRSHKSLIREGWLNPSLPI